MNTGEIIIYQNPEGNIKIDVRLEEENVWLTRAQMALLFGKGRTTITGLFGNRQMSSFMRQKLDNSRKSIIFAP